MSEASTELTKAVLTFIDYDRYTLSQAEGKILLRVDFDDCDTKESQAHYYDIYDTLKARGYDFEGDAVVKHDCVSGTICKDANIRYAMPSTEQILDMLMEEEIVASSTCVDYYDLSKEYDYSEIENLQTKSCLLLVNSEQLAELMQKCKDFDHSTDKCTEYDDTSRHRVVHKMIDNMHQVILDHNPNRST